MGPFQRQLRHHDCKKNSRLRIEGETKRIEDVIHIVVGLSQKKSPRNIATNIIQFHSRSFLSNLYFWITNQQIIFEYFRLTALFKNWKLVQRWLKMCLQYYFHFPYRKWKDFHFSYRKRKEINTRTKMCSKSMVASLALAPNSPPPIRWPPKPPSWYPHCLGGAKGSAL